MDARGPKLRWLRWQVARCRPGSRAPRWGPALCALCVSLVVPGPLHAQDEEPEGPTQVPGESAHGHDDDETNGAHQGGPDLDDAVQALEDFTLPGQDANTEELLAYGLLEAGQPIRARELAEKLLAEHPESFMAHLVLGRVQHEAEGSFPRALFHYQRAIALFEARFGREPNMDQPWRWHAMLLRMLAQAHGDLEAYGERLAYIARFNKLYEPDMIAERAWPLMKLGRYEEAKLAAELALSLPDRPQQRMVALNALCAIEFEAGRDGASYEACKRAIDEAHGAGRMVSSVDLTNFAEASRSLFKLDEAEQVAMEATRVPASWYGNPWLELAELYTRQGRFMDALSALKQIPGYRAQRPPSVRDADKNETRRALSAFLLVIGHAEEAVELTGQALHRPDRRGYSSRDAAQDGVVAALLDRRARLMVAERIVENAAGESIAARAVARAKAAWHRLSAWHSGLLVGRLLSERGPLVGTFRIGTASAAIMPPWLLGELVEVLGPAVAAQAAEAARAEDERPGADAYYDSVLAEAAFARGDARQALEYTRRSLAVLVPSEALVRARMRAVAAESARRQGDAATALAHFEAAFQLDPGVLRRLGMSVPVRIEGASGEVGEAIADGVARSPRFDAMDAGLSVRIQADGARGQACLLGPTDAVLGCGEAQRDADEDTDALAAKVVAALHEAAFAPRVSLSRADINSLDGSNLVGRKALDEALQAE